MQQYKWQRKLNITHYWTDRACTNMWMNIQRCRHLKHTHTHSDLPLPHNLVHILYFVPPPSQPHPPWSWTSCRSLSHLLTTISHPIAAFLNLSSISIPTPLFIYLFSSDCLPFSFPQSTHPSSHTLPPRFPSGDYLLSPQIKLFLFFRTIPKCSQYAQNI